MTHISKLLYSYDAVFAYEEHLKSSYSKYGISFDCEILLTERGEYKVLATAKELELI